MNAKKSKKGKGMMKKLLSAMLLAVVLALGAAGAEFAFADALVWHEVNLSPGDTYNVSSASWNTTVYIKQPGNYKLRGRSESVRVLVQSGGVNLYLDDGLDINCSAHSYTGSRTSAIWVGDQGGKVRLITKPHASVRLEGYMCPGIRKEGTKTCLVLETEIRSDPGTLSVYSGSHDGNRDPAAIGSIDNPTGNIVINSGNIVAKVRGANTCSAAIGGGTGQDASDITINGGNVKAYGSEEGAGIGGGAGGVLTGLYINNGTVYAENSGPSVGLYGGAAIGGGSYDFSNYKGMQANTGAKDLNFLGGTVTAVSHGTGAAIGGGTNSGCSNLNISGGTVNATNVYDGEYYDGAGIGGGFGIKVNCDINISGGFITARGGTKASAIGSQDAGYDENMKSISDRDSGNIRISGGTIIAGCGTGGRGDIGVRGSMTTITGGNVFAQSTSGAVVNGQNQNLHRVVVSFSDVQEKDGFPIGDLMIRPDGYRYGMHDAVTLGGKFHMWLPNTDDVVRAASVKTSAAAAGMYFGGIRFKDSSGTLARGTKITLVPEINGEGENGIAYGIQGESKLWISRQPVPFHGHAAEIMSAASGGVKVADAAGNLEPNVSGFTDGNGNWNCANTSASLYYMIDPYKYTIRFDGNRPRGASTQIDGQMGDMENLAYGTEYNLTANDYQNGNGFDLPGYKFVKWNTKADGSGTDYADQAAVNSLSDKDGGVVTLYAQWEPRFYTIYYSDGLGENGGPLCPTYTQRARFDEPVNLVTYSDTTFGWTNRPNENQALHGWVGQGLGSFYGDGAKVVNLCNTEDHWDGEELPPVPPLVADWRDTEKIVVSVTNDGVPQGGLANYIFLKGKEGNTLDTEIRGVFQQVGPTEGLIDAHDIKYVFDPEDLEGNIPHGTYELCFNTGVPPEGKPTGPEEYMPDSVEITYDNNGFSISTVFDYYTVSIAKDPACPDAINTVTICENADFPQPAPDNKVFVPNGHKVRIQTVMNPEMGYQFDGYSAAGVAPLWDNSPTKATQNITIKGKADIVAHVKANTYKVHFDPNGSGVSGTMEDQNMVWGKARKLSANQFTRVGGTFAGWNTEKDRSGTAYDDMAEVSNLTLTDGGTVNLYAQWDMEVYHIDYDLDGGRLPAGEKNKDTYTAADSFTLVNPTRTDYDFKGWMGTGLTSPQTTVTIEEGSTGDRQYDAVWRMKYYQVQFVDNGGTGVEPQLVKIHAKATKPADPTRSGYRFIGWYEDAGLTKAYDFNREIVKDTTLYAKWESTKVPVLMAWGKSVGRKAIKTSWTPVDGAANYLVYASHCGKKMKLVGKTSKTSWTVKKVGGKKLKAHSPYNFRVTAVDSKGNGIVTSMKIHVIAARTMGKHANANKVTAKKKAITLNAGQKATVKAKVKLPRGKKSLSGKHGAALRYTSDNPSVASVNKKGVVMAKAPGLATIYIQEIGGRYCTVTVTVR